MDIILAVLIWAVPLALAALGFVVALRPAQSKRARNYFLLSFVLIALLGVFSTTFQTYWAGAKTEAESAARRANREKLAEFVKEGLDLRRRCANESEPAPAAEADEWAKRTEAFLRSSLDESYVARFRNSSGLPLTATSISSIPHRNVWGWVCDRLARLNEFLEELSK